MTLKLNPASTPVEPRAQNRQLTFSYRFLRRPAFRVGATLAVLLLVLAVVIPPIVGYDPYSVDPSVRLSPPSFTHLYGTDDFGRDLFSRTNGGFQVSLMIGASVAISSAILGTLLGALAGYYRAVDAIIMRICDGLMAFPGILLAMALVASLGSSLVNVIIALVIVLTPGIARLIRSRVLAIKEELFIEAMRSQGASSLRILLRHILPNTLNVLLVQVAYIFADSIMVEAALSFLGAGVAPPTPSLGNILYDGKQVFLTSPWMVIFPSLMLIVMVMVVNFFGDAVREALDPKASRRRWTQRSKSVWLGRFSNV
ncbi:ABC transporter permease [Microbacterium sp. MPKO10]|uniref:ABC transporter permease n=1 Tax=Microbacterium sp. MPKO10 TaxID=2989818 RepID=UPI0022362A76|nr:ABC transporter permease [Microbacterium sp. MPKO10]MCW4459849.1 ABC transporter permease [Microbacterium sp. MPKO10]